MEKDKFIFLTLLIVLVAIPIVSAADDLPTLGAIKRGATADLTQVCDNCTEVNLTKVLDPYKNVLLLGEYPMTKNGSNYNYTFSNFSFIGDYYYTTCGDLNGNNNCQTVKVPVTSTGQEITTEKSIIYLIFFILLIFLFLITIFGIGKLPPSNARDEEGMILSINNLKYLRATLWLFEWFLLAGMLFLASNLGFAYLGETLFANIFLRVSVIMIAIAPLFITLWALWMIAQVVQDRRIRNLWERGIMPGREL